MRTFAIASLVLTSLFLGACGGDSGGGGGGGPEGTYVMDAEAMKAEMAKTPEMQQAMKAIEKMPADQRAEAEKAMAAGQAEGMKKMDFTVTLSGDGSFSVTGNADGKEQAKGTWKLDGKKLAIVTTHERGKAQENPETLHGTLENGVLRFKPQKDMPFDLVFKKK